MGKILMVFIACFIFGVTIGAMAAVSSDDKELEKEADRMNQMASQSRGERAVVGRIEKNFNVNESVIKDLRNQKMGYGEISIALSLAQKLPGGLTGANINKIMSMRKGPPVEGWGKIAKSLGMKLGPVISNVKKIRAASKKEIAGSGHETGARGQEEKSGKMPQGSSPEKSGGPEKFDRQGGFGGPGGGGGKHGR